MPGEGRVFEDPRILDHLAATLVWVVHTPRAITRSAPDIELGLEEALLDKVGGTDVGLLGNQFLMVVSSGDIVDHTVDFVGRYGVDIRQQPVTRDISLDSPSQCQGTVVFDKVQKTGLRVGLGTRCASNAVRLNPILGFSGRAIGLDIKLQDRVGSVESSYWVLEITFRQGATLWQSPSVEAVAVGED